MATDLARYFAPLLSHHFAGLATPTVKQHEHVWRLLARVVSGRDRRFVGLSSLETADIDACDLPRRYSQIRCLIDDLRAIDEAHPELLASAVKRRLKKISRHAQTSTPREPYTECVSNQLRSRADEAVAAARDRIFSGRKRAVELRTNGCDWPTALQLRIIDGERLPQSDRDRLRPHSIDIRTLAESTLLRTHDACAFIIALGLRCEMPFECLRTLRADCLKNPSGGFVDIEYRKSRGGTAVRIKRERVRDGGISTPGGLVRLALELSGPARERLASSDHPDAAYLWLGYVQSGHPSWRRFRLDYNTFSLAARSYGVTADDGSPFEQFSGARLRKTVKAANYRRKGGHLRSFATDHTPRAASKHYASVEALAEDHAKAVEAAQERLLGSAMTPLILSPSEEEEALLNGLERQGRTFTGSELVPALSGSEDTFLGACLDFWHSPLVTAEDGSCSSGFSSCLHCRNAVFTRRKLPAIICYLDWIEDRRSILSISSWTAAHGLDHARITKQILPRFSEKDVAHARSRVTESVLPVPLHIARG
ncbi:hypothetical protein [Allosphingosinicella humi]